MIRVVAFDFYGVAVRDQVDEARVAVESTAQGGALETMLHGYFSGDASLSDINKVIKNAGSPLEISHHGSRDLNHSLFGLIKSLRGHGLKAGIVGNMGLEDAHWIWKQNHDQKLFDFLVPSSEMKVLMPAQPIFDQLSERSRTSPASQVYVAATQDGADAAAAAGVIGVLFSSSDRLAEILAKLIADS